MRVIALVAGQNGQVARSLAALSSRDVEFVTVGRPELDITDAASVARVIERVEPAVVVNPAAYTAVDKAESASDAAFSVNHIGARNVAEAAASANLPVIHFSTDYVFAGDKKGRYSEDDPPGPTGVYGRSKLAGEAAVAAVNPAHVILRTAWIYSPYGANFLKTMLGLAAERDVLRVVGDQQGTPTYAPDIAVGVAAVIGRIVADPHGLDWRGVFHMVAQGETDWAGFAETIFAVSSALGGPSAAVERIRTADYPTPARRPANSRLETAKLRRIFQHELPDWRNGVERCLTAINAD